MDTWFPGSALRRRVDISVTLDQKWATRNERSAAQCSSVSLQSWEPGEDLICLLCFPNSPLKEGSTKEKSGEQWRPHRKQYQEIWQRGTEIIKNKPKKTLVFRHFSSVGWCNTSVRSFRLCYSLILVCSSLQTGYKASQCFIVFY